MSVESRKTNTTVRLGVFLLAAFAVLIAGTVGVAVAAPQSGSPAQQTTALTWTHGTFGIPISPGNDASGSAAVTPGVVLNNETGSASSGPVQIYLVSPAVPQAPVNGGA